MTQEMKDNALYGIDCKREAIRHKMLELNRKYDGKAVYYDDEYNMLKAELYKLDYQAIEIKEQVAE